MKSVGRWVLYYKIYMFLTFGQILEGTNEIMRVIVSRKLLMEGALEVIK